MFRGKRSPEHPLLSGKLSVFLLVCFSLVCLLPFFPFPSEMWESLVGGPVPFLFDSFQSFAFFLFPPMSDGVDQTIGVFFLLIPRVLFPFLLLRAVFPHVRPTTFCTSVPCLYPVLIFWSSGEFFPKIVALDRVISFSRTDVVPQKRTVCPQFVAKLHFSSPPFVQAHLS